jgi:succinate dehydrogenase / fumarate reductase cytochrome b subunit
MSSTALSIPRFLEAPIGKKAVMAVPGLVLFGFVIGHLLGNLQFFLGPEKFDHYAVALREVPPLLWGVRLVLLVSVTAHIVTSIQLAALKRKARPVDYARKESISSTYASRTMMWSGPILAAFVVYHLLHFTFGVVHPAFEDLKPYENVVEGFRSIPVSLAYAVAMLLLGTHLYHGIWSMFQSLGVSHPRYSAMLRKFAALMTGFIVLGFLSIPISVVTGIFP